MGTSAPSASAIKMRVKRAQVALPLAEADQQGSPAALPLVVDLTPSCVLLLCLFELLLLVAVFPFHAAVCCCRDCCCDCCCCCCCC